MSNSEDSQFSISLGAALAHGCCGGQVRRIPLPAASAEIVALPVRALPSEGGGNPVSCVPTPASVDTLPDVDLRRHSDADSVSCGHVTIDQTPGEPR